jgi:hypothetical protein
MSAYERFEAVKRQLHTREREHAERLAGGAEPTDAHRREARRLTQHLYDGNWRRWQRDGARLG